MDFSLTEEQERLRDGIIRFARRELNAGAAERDQKQIFPRDLWQKCAEIGLVGLPIPEAYGGSGLDPLSTILALEAFGYGCHDGGLVFSVGAHLLACAVPIWKFGTEEQKARYLPPLCSGQFIAVNSMSEPQSGSDAFAMHTRAEPYGEGFCLNGTKTFSTNGPVADLSLVFTVTDPKKGYFGGTTAFLVEKGTPGFSATHKIEKMGLRSSPMSELVLENVCVPSTAVLGGVGGGAAVFAHAMDWERIGIFASNLGVIERLLEKAIEYARVRTQFGQAIGKFQAVSHRIVDIKVRLEAARWLVYRAAWQLDKAKPVSMDASIAKLMVSESLVFAALNTVQILGGYGYTTEYEVERVLRDAIGSTIYSGTSDIQRNIIARWLGL